MNTPNVLAGQYGLSANEKPSASAYSKGLFAFAILAFIGLGIMSYLYFFQPEKNSDSPNVASDTVRKDAEPGKSQEPTNTTRGIPNQPLQPTNPKPTPIERASITEEVTATLNGWAATTRAHDFDTHMSYYADTLETYYKRQGVSLNFVRSNRSRAFKLYSTLDIQLSNMKITPDSSGLRATATFDKYFNFQNREKSFSGSVQQMIWLAKIDGRWRIVGEKDLQVY